MIWVIINCSLIYLFTLDYLQFILLSRNKIKYNCIPLFLDNWKLDIHLFRTVFAAMSLLLCLRPSHWRLCYIRAEKLSLFFHHCSHGSHCPHRCVIADSAMASWNHLRDQTAGAPLNGVSTSLYPSYYPQCRSTVKMSCHSELRLFTNKRRW